MIRWRLIAMPLIVLAVGVWAATRTPPPSLDVKPGQSIEDKASNSTKDAAGDSGKKDPAVSDNKIVQIEPISLEKMLETDPVRFLRMSLEKYDKEITGYTLTFDKHERVNGRMLNPETTEVRFREKPFSVFMKWTKNPGLASQVLYVEGENKNKLLGRGRGVLTILGIQEREVDGPDAKAAGRFTIAQFGFKRSTQRSLASMENAQARGKLFTKYEGIVPVEKLGGQMCHKLVRFPYEPYEEDDLKELTLYFDTEHLLQVGSILRDKKGDLLGEYFFSNVRINPEFEAKQFTREAL